MNWFSIEYISMALGFLLLLIGVWGILTQKDLIRIIVGFSLFDTGLHVIMVAIGYVRGKKAPILDSAVDLNNAANQIVDPLPQALVLTAIVIGLGVTALMLAYAVKMYKEKKTTDISKFNDLKW